MASGVVQKLIESHLVSGEMAPGREVSLRIDQTLTQDATGTMIYLQYEAIGGGTVKTELSVSYVDHNTIQSGFENADDHEYLRTVAAWSGIVYSRPGNGICHQVHLERFGKPGKTLLGADSHTPTGGGVGMFAVGAGGLDIAMAMAGRPFSIRYPHVYKVALRNKLGPWVSAKDVILWLLRELSSKGNVGVAIEYAGGGVRTLSVPERATITNMGAELGVTTSVFPSDNVTRKFLAAQGREGDFIELRPDAGARYARVIRLDLAEVKPLAAAPHSPDNVKPVSELAGMHIDQVCIGSCTNSSYKDLMTAARILEGKKIAKKVSFVVAPGSRQALQMITANGALETLISAGARVAESACGFCIGNSHAPRNDAVSIRTSNRNFVGRSGTKTARVYLTSVETAVASVIAGEMVDPQTLGRDACPRIKQPKSFIVDDSMLVSPPPEDERERIRIYRGPNIGELPKNDALPNELQGVVQIKVGDEITTDHIIPAGALLTFRSNVTKYSQYVFSPIDDTFAARCAAAKAGRRANLVLAGESYGQGSSREHAALCPMFLGVRAVIAKSFERIHSANLINFGILPLVLAHPADYDRIDQGDDVVMGGLPDAVGSGKFVLRNTTKGLNIELRCELTARQKAMILAGGAFNLAKEK